MSEHHVFAADWLSLREPADHAARSRLLFAELAAFLESRAAPDKALNIVDLGAGAGSNLRWLAPRLDHAQAWTLVDRDAGLLARATAQAVQSPSGHSIAVRTVETDLSNSTLPWIADADLVTSAAFFDLVSAEWIARLSRACADAEAACLFVLSVDGQWAFTDGDGNTIGDEDVVYVQELFNQHQRRNKGLGAALGPDAAPWLARSLAKHGLEVSTAASDWNLVAGDELTRALGAELMAGWRQAALEQAPQAADRIERWHRRRQADLADGRLGLRVGHLDVLGLPPQS